MIARIWKGTTSREKALAYKTFLEKEIFTELTDDPIKGFRKIQVLTRNLGNEVEFTTIMWFDSIEAVKIFAGENYEQAYVSEKARTFLTQFDKQSIHTEVVSEYIAL